jgi:hypothetical protein
MTEPSRKLQFALEMDGDWPPVSSEAVWCVPEGTRFKLQNAPFFIKGLAVNDVFEAAPDPVNGHIFEFQVTRPSEHCLVWLLNNTDAPADSVLAPLRELGCSTEGLERFSLYAIDVPPRVPDLELNAVLDAAENAGFDLAFPVWRRE